MIPSKTNDEFFLELVNKELLVSESGVVFNLNTSKEIGYETGGYKRINMHGKTMAVNRLVYLVYVNKDIPKGFLVDHLDGNKLNNHFKNLEAVSYSVNNTRAFELGLQTATSEAKKKCKEGVKNNNAKFTEEEVLFYRDLYKDGASIVSLSKMANVLPKAMGLMLNKKTYRNI